MGERVSPSQAFSWYFVAWLTAVAALILYRLLSGQIALDGLLTMDGQRFSPERLQLLLVTLAALAIYAEEALANQKMPEVPDGLLPILVGSHVLYLGGKIAGR
jgi:hypothetical protein